MMFVSGGSFSDVIATTRLIKELNETNVKVLKSCLFSELECKNDKQFLCKILPLIYKSISPQSIINLKNKSISLAENQSSYQYTNSNQTNSSNPQIQQQIINKNSGAITNKQQARQCIRKVATLYIPMKGISSYV